MCFILKEEEEVHRDADKAPKEEGQICLNSNITQPDSFLIFPPSSPSQSVSCSSSSHNKLMRKIVLSVQGMVFFWSNKINEVLKRDEFHADEVKKEETEELK